MTAGPDGVDVVVDAEACLSSQSCVRALPTAFAIGDDGVSVVLPSVTATSLDSILAAARDCPVGAIDVRRGDTSILDHD
jgi:ferredoxin